MLPFLKGFGYQNYVDDSWGGTGEELCKVAGQLCYMSFGELRTYNKDIQRYIDNIIEQGHGSVLEHANYSILCYGISRSTTHELVRHRAGFSFSQLSQRYCGPQTLRFVMRPEVTDIEKFENFIDYVMEQYRELTVQDGTKKKRKQINQLARMVLPNCTEAPIIVTANVRAWRHFIEARGNEHADPEIRWLALKIWGALLNKSEVLFSGYTMEGLLDSNIPCIRGEKRSKP